MDINEIKEKKRELENQILALAQKFEEETNVHIIDIDDQDLLLGNNSRKIVGIYVRLELL